MAIRLGTSHLTSTTLGSSPVTTGGQISMAFWYYPLNNTATHTPVSIQSDSGGNGHRIQVDLRGDLGNNPIRAIQKGTGAFSFGASYNSSFSANTWHHFVGTWNGYADQNVYFNGSGNTASDTTNVSPSDTYDNAYLNFYQGDGYLAEVGIWNGAIITAAEIDSLFAGTPCSKVRPDALVAYLPLRRGEVIDFINGSAWTVGGTETYAANPPKLAYPRRRAFFLPSAAVTTIDLSAGSWGSWSAQSPQAALSAALANSALSSWSGQDTQNTTSPSLGAGTVTAWTGEDTQNAVTTNLDAGSMGFTSQAVTVLTNTVLALTNAVMNFSGYAISLGATAVAGLQRLKGLIGLGKMGKK